MKALTVRPEPAALIALGLKLVENRTWRTSYRGDLLIHAGRPRSAIVCLVTVWGCVPLDEVEGDEDATGPWCWLLSGVRRLKHPVGPCSGRLGLWQPCAALVAAVKDRLD